MVSFHLVRLPESFQSLGTLMNVYNTFLGQNGWKIQNHFSLAKICRNRTKLIEN